MWLEKSLTFNQLHMEVFKQIRFVLREWIDMKDPEKFAALNANGQATSKKLPEFPYAPKSTTPGKHFTVADWDALSLEEQFNLCLLKQKETGKPKNIMDSPEALEDMPY